VWGRVDRRRHAVDERAEDRRRDQQIGKSRDELGKPRGQESGRTEAQVKRDEQSQDGETSKNGAAHYAPQAIGVEGVLGDLDTDSHGNTNRNKDKDKDKDKTKPPKAKTGGEE